MLRLPRRDDVEALVGFGDDPDVGATLWVPIPSPCSRADAETRLGEFVDGWCGRSAFGPTFVVASAADDEFLGVFFLRARGDDVVEVSYGTAPRHRGRGIATAALLRLSGWCFARLHARRVELLISAGNLASLRVAAKAGFEFGGTRRTHVPGTGEEYDDLLYVRDAPSS
jgi:RimJ/RimL family protein N-acetyltransferase